MLTELKAIFESVDKEVLSEETLKSISTLVEQKINEKVNDRVSLEVEEKLSNMDKDHAAKFKQVLENIDADHTTKVKQVVGAINKNHIGKLYVLKEKYDKVLKETAVKHRNMLVEAVSKYLDAYLEKTVPAKLIQEAAQNKFHAKVVEEARQILGVDTSFIKANVKEAIKDGKEQMDKLVKENADLKKKTLISESKRLLIEKTENLPTETARFIREKLSNKTPQFISENFSYVLEMFGRKEKNEKNSLLNEGKKPNVDRAGVADELINESGNFAQNTPNPDNTSMGMYLEGMAIRK